MLVGGSALDTLVGNYGAEDIMLGGQFRHDDEAKKEINFEQLESIFTDSSRTSLVNNPLLDAANVCDDRVLDQVFSDASLDWQLAS